MQPPSEESKDDGLTHFDSQGNAIMVDVSAKAVTNRVAIARGSVRMMPATLKMIEDGAAKKGDVLGVARLAGIMAAKRTADLIPLCHPIALTSVKLDLFCDSDNNLVNIMASCAVADRTGIEMEALTAVSVAALTVYDMCKCVDKQMRIQDIHLVHKSGGRTGEFNVS